MDAIKANSENGEKKILKEFDVTITFCNDYYYSLHRTPNEHFGLDITIDQTCSLGQSIRLGHDTNFDKATVKAIRVTAFLTFIIRNLLSLRDEFKI